MLFWRENFSFNLCCWNYFHNRLQDLQMLTNTSSVINKKNQKFSKNFRELILHGHLIFMYSELRETQMPRLSPAMRTVLSNFTKSCKLSNATRTC